MTYDITYECGHTGKVDLYGTSRERDRRVWALEHRKCPACEQAERAARDAEAAAANAAAGLPQLTGTEKQVPWAEDIRAKMGAYIGEAMEREKQRVRPNPLHMQAVEQVRREFLGHTDAGWFIDHRSDYAREFESRVTSVYVKLKAAENGGTEQ